MAANTNHDERDVKSERGRTGFLLRVDKSSAPRAALEIYRPPAVRDAERALRESKHSNSKLNISSRSLERNRDRTVSPDRHRSFGNSSPLHEKAEVEDLEIRSPRCRDLNEDRTWRSERRLRHGAARTRRADLFNYPYDYDSGRVKYNRSRSRSPRREHARETENTRYSPTSPHRRTAEPLTTFRRRSISPEPYFRSPSPKSPRRTSPPDNRRVRESAWGTRKNEWGTRKNENKGKLFFSRRPGKPRRDIRRIRQRAWNLQQDAEKYGKNPLKQLKSKKRTLPLPRAPGADDRYGDWRRGNKKNHTDRALPRLPLHRTRHISDSPSDEISKLARGNFHEAAAPAQDLQSSLSSSFAPQPTNAAAAPAQDHRSIWSFSLAARPTLSDDRRAVEDEVTSSNDESSVEDEVTSSDDDSSSEDEVTSSDDDSSSEDDATSGDDDSPAADEEQNRHDHNDEMYGRGGPPRGPYHDPRYAQPPHPASQQYTPSAQPPYGRGYQPPGAYANHQG